MLRNTFPVSVLQAELYGRFSIFAFFIVTPPCARAVHIYAFIGIDELGEAQGQKDLQGEGEAV